MRADLTSAEIAKSGSYFDDVTRDPRPHGIENTTDKVRRPGAVRRRRDAVCTERIVGELDKGESAPFPGAVHELRVIHAGLPLGWLARCTILELESSNEERTNGQD